MSSALRALGRMCWTMIRHPLLTIRGFRMADELHSLANSPEVNYLLEEIMACDDCMATGALCPTHGEAWTDLAPDSPLTPGIRMQEVADDD